MPTLPDDPNLATLPKASLDKLERIRAKQTVAIAAAVSDLGGKLEHDTEAAIEKIERSGYRGTVIRSEIRKLMFGHYDGVAVAMGAQQVRAAELVGQYAQVMDAHVTTGILGPALERPSLVPPRAAMGNMDPSRLLRLKVKPPRQLTPGDAILREHVKPWSKARVLSSDLHGKAKAATRQIRAHAMAAVRESKQLTEAATNMISAVRTVTKGAELAGKEQLSQLMQRVEAAGTALNRRGGQEALAEWQQVRREMRRYMRGLEEAGRTRSSMLELLQRTKDTSAKGIGRAIRQHAAFKQKHAAERILKTEALAAFKADQVLSDMRRDYVVGYIWRMNRGARRGFVKRRTTKTGRVSSPRKFRRGGKGRRCVCESLAGRRLSKEMVSGRTARLMAHPHCFCYLEPVMDKRRLARAQAIDFEP